MHIAAETETQLGFPQKHLPLIKNQDIPMVRGEVTSSTSVQSLLPPLLRPQACAHEEQDRHVTITSFAVPFSPCTLAPGSAMQAILPQVLLKQGGFYHCKGCCSPGHDKWARHRILDHALRHKTRSSPSAGLFLLGGAAAIPPS